MALSIKNNPMILSKQSMQDIMDDIMNSAKDASAFELWAHEDLQRALAEHGNNMRNPVVQEAHTHYQTEHAHGQRAQELYRLALELQRSYQTSHDDLITTQILRMHGDIINP
jgi:predicted trehalose synthase